MRVACKLICVISLMCVTSGWAADRPVNGRDDCDRPVYMTFDTGHMGVAPLIAEVLSRQKVRATFFLANEPTRTGGTSLDAVWAPWWKLLSEQGHVFASHTFDHVYWLSDLGAGRFKVRASSGPQAGKSQEWSAQQYCDELIRVDARFEVMTGQKMLPLFRAAGGKTSPELLEAAQACGYKHVGWMPAGFLGDELPSAQYPNAFLLERALRNIRSGDILLAHLGIWSRQEPWAPVVLEPLIEGLKKKGFCFATIDTHPDFRPWVLAHRQPFAPPVIVETPDIGEVPDPDVRNPSIENTEQQPSIEIMEQAPSIEKTEQAPRGYNSATETSAPT